MKKEKNGTLHWLELNVTQSPWVVEQCPECGSEVWLKRDEKTGKWTHERRNEMTKPEKMVIKTVHDLGTAIDSDVCNYTGLSTRGNARMTKNGKTTETAEPQPDGIQFRTVDDLGRICIPKDIRDKLGIEPGTECAVYSTDELTSEQIIVIRRNKNDKH